MDNSEKQGSSESSSSSSSDERSSKRSYECTFCKRGFTNAQALGGHMNIHRKDRAKAKQQYYAASTVHNNNNPSHNNYKYQQELVCPATASPYHIVPSNNISSGPAMLLEACFRAPVPSPRLSHPQYGYYGSSTNGPASLSLGATDELLGANLSLRLGPVEENGQLDLELRLGHFP